MKPRLLIGPPRAARFAPRATRRASAPRPAARPTAAAASPVPSGRRPWPIRASSSTRGRCSTPRPRRRGRPRPSRKSAARRRRAGHPCGPIVHAPAAARRRRRWRRREAAALPRRRLRRRPDAGAAAALLRLRRRAPPIVQPRLPPAPGAAEAASFKATTWVAECCRTRRRPPLRSGRRRRRRPRARTSGAIGARRPRADGLRPPPKVAPPPTRLGHGATALAARTTATAGWRMRHASRSTPSAGAPLEERIAPAPAWRFSAESASRRAAAASAPRRRRLDGRRAPPSSLCARAGRARTAGGRRWSAGHWHAADVEAELGLPQAVGRAPRRVRRLRPRAAGATGLGARLRLLMMVGRLTRRTPVAAEAAVRRPWGSAEEMERVVDERTSPVALPPRRPRQGASPVRLAPRVSPNRALFKGLPACSRCPRPECCRCSSEVGRWMERPRP